MISTKFLFLIGLVACLNSQLVDSLSCKNEKGEDVDWYVLLKPPKQKHSNPRISVGGAYGIVDSKSKTAGWKLAEKDIGDVGSYPGQTFKEVYAKPDQYSYVMWNDAKPDESSDSSIYAHAKGNLVWNDKEAVWFIHSAPKYMPVYHSNKYGYPETAKTHGQNFMCITMKSKDSVNTVLNHVVTMKAQVYSTHINKNAEMNPQIQENINIISKKVKSNKGELPKGGKVDDARIKQLTTTIKSKGGETFTIISKSRKDEVDIWSNIAAPALKVKEFAVKTWTLLQKAAALLSSTCNIKERLYNVMDMNVELSNEKIEWGKNDHSKWGLCVAGGNNCYCQGDMNRATSQFKRGGGVVCFNNKATHDTFEKSFSTQYSCSNKLEKNPKK